MKFEYFESSDSFESLQSLEVTEAQILRGVALSCMSRLRRIVSQGVHFGRTWMNILYDVSLVARTSHGDVAKLHAGCVVDL